MELVRGGAIKGSMLQSGVSLFLFFFFYSILLQEAGNLNRYPTTPEKQDAPRGPVDITGVGPIPTLAITR